MNYLKVNHLKWAQFTHFSKQKYQNNRWRPLFFIAIIEDTWC